MKLSASADVSDAVVDDGLGKRQLPDDPVSENARDKTPEDHALRVLIVEDSVSLGAALKRAFAATGWPADIAGGVQIANHMFCSGHYDVAVIDYHLPDGTGDALLERFRHQQPDCICIMMTANTVQELVAVWIKRGAAAYVSKPFDFAYLLELCKRARRERGLLQAEAQLAEQTVALTRSELSYRLLFEQMFEAFASHEIICDDAGIPIDYRFLAVNPAFERLTGLRAETTIGKTVLELLPETEPFWIETLGRVALTGAPAHFEHKSAALAKTFEVRAFRSAPLQFACVFSDISERKQMEDVLRSSLRQAEAATEAKNHFLANMSHEIRTPMNGVLGMAQLLAATRLDETQQTYVDMLQQSGVRMMMVINEILDISRIEAGKLDIDCRRLNLDAVTDSVLNPLRLLAEAKGLAVHVEFEPRISEVLYGDDIRIGQVLTNLVGNAIKFTERGMVTIRCEQVSAFDQTVVIRFSITDTGSGIPADTLPLLFEPFMQADASYTRRHGGAGLGLAISRQLAQLMNGDVTIQSEIKKGTTAAFTLALATEPPVAAAESTGAAEESPAAIPVGAKVLVVEDDPVSAFLAQQMLIERGFDVTAVANGLEALEALKCATYDLVFMDVQMPVMDGLTATGKIRKSKFESRNVPIVAMTAHAMTGDQERCLGAGMDHYVTKPFSADDLLTALSRCMAAKAHPGSAAHGDGGGRGNGAINRVWDRDGLYKRLDGKTTLIEHVLSIGTSNLPRQMASLAQSLADQDALKVEQDAHAVKGACANIGAVRMQQIAFQIERCRLDGPSDVEAADALFRDLQSAFIELQDVLAERSARTVKTR